MALGRRFYELVLDAVSWKIGLTGEGGRGGVVKRLVDPFAHGHAGFSGGGLHGFPCLKGHALYLPRWDFGTAGCGPIFHGL